MTPGYNVTSIYGAATRISNGDAIVVGVQLGPRVFVLRNGKLVKRAQLPASSYTSAAASRTHVFVSTIDALITFDADVRAFVQTFNWVGGGTSPPAIGPQGHVYAIAANTLFVFPPPKRVVRPIPTLSSPARPSR